MSAAGDEGRQSLTVWYVGVSEGWQEQKLGQLRRGGDEAQVDGSVLGCPLQGDCYLGEH